MTKSKSKYVGVDGCPCGWVSIGLDDNCGYEVKVFAEFGDLVDYYSDACLILVDMPIGLPKGSQAERGCNPAARSLLRKPRSSSVFRVPTREAVHKVAEGLSFEEAKKLEQDLTGGKSISEQARWIMDKIDQVDRVMTTQSKNAFPRIREIHPELCFWGLNKKTAMKNKKKPVKGSKERLEVLSTVECLSETIYNKACGKWRRYEVARDDILDAFVPAVTAKLSYTDAYTLQSIPAAPQWDEEKCLRMEMVYVSKKDLDKK